MKKAEMHIVIPFFVFFLIGCAVNIFMDYQQEEPVASQYEKEMQQEFRKLSNMDGAVQTSYESHHQYVAAIVSANYSTNKNYDQIKAFYLREAKINGWDFQKEAIGKGDKILYFTKDPATLSINFWDNDPGRFVISLEWTKNKALFGSKY